MRCTTCNIDIDDVFSHFNTRHRDYLYRLNKIEDIIIKPITEPLNSFPRGYRPTKTLSYQATNVYACYNCKIKIGSVGFQSDESKRDFIKCPLCGEKLYDGQNGQGAIKNLWIKPKKSKKEKEYKSMPPMMKKVHE